MRKENVTDPTQHLNSLLMYKLTINSNSLRASSLRRPSLPNLDESHPIPVPGHDYVPTPLVTNRFGVFPWNSGLKGQMDEMRLWNVARTQADDDYLSLPTSGQAAFQRLRVDQAKDIYEQCAHHLSGSQLERDVSIAMIDSARM